jgi:Ser-tRNA(Ala) deacylase AlaX
VGSLVVTKVENKGKRNKRVYVAFAGVNSGMSPAGKAGP